jgi:hypothetical protein
VTYTCSALPVALKLGVEAELLAAALVASVIELTTRQALIVIATARAMRPAVEFFLLWVSWDTPTPQSFLWAAVQPVENSGALRPTAPDNIRPTAPGQHGANRKGQRGANGELAKLPGNDSAR